MLEHFSYKNEYKVSKPDKLKSLIEKRYKYNEVQNEHNINFFTSIRQNGFDSDFIDHMLNGGRILKDQTLYSIILTDDRKLELKSTKSPIDFIKNNIEISTEEENLRRNKIKKGRSM